MHTRRRAAAGTSRPTGARAWWHCAVAAMGDLGVLVPIVVLLVVVNGLSASAVLVPVGLLYVVVALCYRVPVPVQPMKAMTALALAEELPADVIAAGALTIGAIFLAAGATGLLDRIARVMPLAVVRGVQLAVGIALIEVAYGLLADPPATFTAQLPPMAAACVAGLLVVMFAYRPRAGLALAMVGAVAAMVVLGPSDPRLGPTAVTVPDLSAEAFALAAVLLVIPQVPLTATSSCIATADAVSQYYGPRARRVWPGRLAMTLGAGNLVSGAIAGMPMCHGSGGVSAHYRFGGRTGVTPALAGCGLLAIALVLGADFPRRVAAFPVPLLAALLITAGLVHLRLLLGLRRRREWALALAVGVGSLAANLAGLVIVAIAVWWALPAFRGGATMGRPAASAAARASHDSP